MRIITTGVLAILAVAALAKGLVWAGVILATVAACVALLGLLTNKD